MGECEHIIGLNYDIDWADVTTLKQLKEFMKIDKGEEVEILCFNYCPMCGEKLNWDDYSIGENTI